jgi:hypothetical protein
MRESLAIAERTVRTAEDSAQRELRAYISIQTGAFFDQDRQVDRNLNGSLCSSMPAEHPRTIFP